jgi:hypothetical protein
MQLIMNKNISGVFIAVLTHIDSFLNIFFARNATIKNPVKTLAGAGAIAMENGIMTIDQ